LRLFESILLVLVLIAALRILLPLPLRSGQVSAVIAVLLAAAGLLHLLSEGVRWQMIPLYVWAAAAAAVLLLNPRFLYRSSLGLIIGKLLFFLLALVFSLPPLLLPVPKLPAPTGPYSIGTTNFEWVDETRIDPYSGEPRRLVVQAWYPGEHDPHAKRAPYFDHLNLAGPAVARQFNLPPFLLGHLNLVRTNSQIDISIPGQVERFPVLLFSHGWTGIRGQNTYQMEELASHGFVVLSADHTYGAALTVFSNGEVVFYNPDALPRGVSQEEYDQAARILGETWSGDLIFMLDQAEEMDSGDVPSPFQGRLDLERVGALGHSTGGGAVVEFCFIDPRCKAGLPMDAWLIPYDRSIPEQGLAQPFLFLNSELWRLPRNPELVDRLVLNAQEKSYRVVILGTSHYDFADMPVISPLAHFAGFKGPLPTRVVMEIINRYSTAFFQRTLDQDQEYSLDDLAETYSDFVLVERHLP
jgi:predicted dienelactone hydrolase